MTTPIDERAARRPIETTLADGEAGTRRSRDRSLLHGVAWNGIAKLIAQSAAWASTLVVARLLSPDDYGVVGMAVLCGGVIDLVAEASASAFLSNYSAATAESALRRERAKEMMDRMTGGAGLAPITPKVDSTPGFLRLPALLEQTATEESIDEVRGLGVERGYPKVLSELEAVASRLEGVERRWPGAIELVKNLSHSQLIRESSTRNAKELLFFSSEKLPV